MKISYLWKKPQYVTFLLELDKIGIHELLMVQNQAWRNEDAGMVPYWQPANHKVSQKCVSYISILSRLFTKLNPELLWQYLCYVL